jgi:hypothetical protein
VPTIDEIMALNPCYSRDKILVMTGGKDPISMIEIARLESVSIQDRLWALLRLVPEQTARNLACDFADHALPIFEAEFPTDRRPRECVETARRYAEGESTKQELDAARAAVWYSVWYSARAAVWYSALAARAAGDAGDAAYYSALAARDAALAARYAARADETRWQLDAVVSRLTQQ